MAGALACALSIWAPTRLGAQTITVVANPAFRPTAVLVPHFGYTVAVDAAAGGAVLRELTIPPVTFSGTVRVEGVQPGAREAEAGPFADSVRFDPDGRVSLLVADAAGRPPIVVEAQGSRGATAGRLVVTAASWPVGRALLVTIEPADIYEHGWRASGYGVRDRIRVDDRRAIAFLADTSVRGTVIAVAVGRGAEGRMQTDAATVVVTPRVPEPVPERRTVGKLVLALDPARDEGGNIRAEVLFGLGASEEEAVRALERGAAETPVPSVPPPSLRLTTPSADLGSLLAHALNAARPMVDWERLAGVRALPSAADDHVVRAEDAWYTALVAGQLGVAEVPCAEYALFKSRSDARGRPPAALAPRLGASGPYLWVSDSAGSAGAAAQVQRGYACYRATRDSAWLAAEGRVLARLAGGDEDARPLDAAGLEAAAMRLAPPVDTGRAAWRWASDVAAQGLRVTYGRLPFREEGSGQSLRAVGALLEVVARGVFGVEERLDEVVVAPRLGGIADAETWRLDGWRIRGDSLSVQYRPADRSATIRLRALTRRRVVVQFPWLAPTSCARVRRGAQPPEALSLIQLADGSAFVDLRAYWESAELTVSAEPCR
jgi:hypothetical protein